MHRLSLHMDSPALGHPVRVQILCPVGRGPFCVVYLLHGLGADCEVWRSYDVETVAARYRLMVVMPDGGQSYYVNDPRPAGLGAWEDAIVRDVRGAVDRMFRTVAARTARGIAGVSMGGYGALMLGLRHPDVFGAVGVLSGSLYFGHKPHPRGQAYQTALASSLPRGAYDVFSLAENVSQRPERRPAVWLACGLDDGHLRDHREFRNLLARLDWPCAYQEGPGGHDRDFWQPRLSELFSFMNDHLVGEENPLES